MVLDTRRKWPRPRPRRQPPETETLTIFLETETSRPRPQPCAMMTIIISSWRTNDCSTLRCRQCLPQYFLGFFRHHVLRTLVGLYVIDWCEVSVATGEILAENETSLYSRYYQYFAVLLYLVLVLKLYLSTFFGYWYWYLYLHAKYWYLYWYLNF